VNGHSDASAYDTIILKYVVKTVAFGIDEADDDLNPAKKKLLKRAVYGWLVLQQ
jgi:hypothetical protein